MGSSNSRMSNSMIECNYYEIMNNVNKLGYAKISCKTDECSKKYDTLIDPLINQLADCIKNKEKN